MVHPLVYIGGILCIPAVVLGLVYIILLIGSWFECLSEEAQFAITVAVPTVIGIIFMIVGINLGG